MEKIPNLLILSPSDKKDVDYNIIKEAD